MKNLSGILNKIITESKPSFLNAENRNRSAGEGKWTAIEILGHLIDSANNNIQRFVRGTYEDNFKIIYNQNEWVKHQHYTEADPEELIQLWLLLNRQIVRIWENYPEDSISKVSDIGQQTPELKTILQIAEGYIEHLNHHLGQIRRLTGQVE
jgi:hypothetical protein